LPVLDDHPEGFVGIGDEIDVGQWIAVNPDSAAGPDRYFLRPNQLLCPASKRLKVRLALAVETATRSRGISAAACAGEPGGFIVGSRAFGPGTPRACHGRPAADLLGRLHSQGGLHRGVAGEQLGDDGSGSVQSLEELELVRGEREQDSELTSRAMSCAVSFMPLRPISG
jgi:hypothetical protein